MRHGKVIGVDDEKFRIRWVTQALRDGLGLPPCACGHNEQHGDGARKFASVHHWLPSVNECEQLLQSGMLPCFFFGFVSRLFSRARRAVIMRARVSAGSMTASM